jgi:neutral ceramidase
MAQHVESGLRAGAAVAEITPAGPAYLYGYPHVRRVSTGVHDPLYASALYLNDGRQSWIMVANDIIWVPHAVVRRARERIADATGVPGGAIMITATHTHSGPITVRLLSGEDDPTVPEPDPAYLRRLEDGIVSAAVDAVGRAGPAEVGFGEADGSSVGTNRRDPAEASDPRVPVLLVRQRGGGAWVAVCCVCSMHPTVLHEDSTVISGDFPGMCRQHLQKAVVGERCAVLHHLGAAGNQSPRHVTRANTLAEARRLGVSLGRAIERAMDGAEFHHDWRLRTEQRFVDALPVRSFPSPDEAAARLDRAAARLAELRDGGAPRADIRTAECDCFGAQETLTLARAAAAGRVEAVAQRCLPAEVQLLQVGPHRFVGWPAEVFVEFALEVKANAPNTYVITLANGQMEGYLVTAEAVAEGGYEASNALFQSPDAGQRLVAATLALVRGRS